MGRQMTEEEVIAEAFGKCDKADECVMDPDCMMYEDHLALEGEIADGAL
jgi:hypothetical protein